MKFGNNVPVLENSSEKFSSILFPRTYFTYEALYASLQLNSIQFNSLHFTSLHFTSLHFTSSKRLSLILFGF
jgi:hypothetical protein